MDLVVVIVQLLVLLGVRVEVPEFALPVPNFDPFCSRFLWLRCLAIWRLFRIRISGLYFLLMVLLGIQVCSDLLVNELDLLFDIFDKLFKPLASIFAPF